MPLQSTDPICFARDENSDLIMPLRVARGTEAIAIMVRCTLKLWRGEYYLNRDAGTPWIETEDGSVSERDAILGQAFDPQKLQRVLRPVILGVGGGQLVSDVTQFRASFDGETRSLTVSCVAKSAFGDAPVTVQIAA